MPRRCSGSASGTDWCDRHHDPWASASSIRRRGGAAGPDDGDGKRVDVLALSRLSGIVSDTVRQSESVTAVTSALAGALEREDDAVLLILAGDDRELECWHVTVRSWIRLSPTSSVSWNLRTT